MNNKLTYSIVMFAYNEEKNIKNSILSIQQQKSAQLNKFYLIANGCTDNTAKIAEQVKLNEGFTELEIIELSIGDKCNAWNHYIHNLAEYADVHFFVDADVKFSDRCFDLMAEHLTQSPQDTVTIAGMPLTGRNKAYYESLVIERACFFGNLYGLRHRFIERLQNTSFHLPKGLNWIDSFLTKAVNTDLTFGNKNLPNRVTYLEGTGYLFDNLSVFSWADINLYLSRIARYELGKLQERYLDQLNFNDWPESMKDINLQLDKNFEQETISLSFIKKFMVKKRLKRLILKAAK
ncbi:glycosyltransferase family A protein [Paraglaciecola sp. L3A3]|uniref:glycosyltransferase family A protein n=1 Tax=Paraglaciecola sp. L3A3 TaxID=2686358 RepID=UPI00131DA062|nr:glycosyltransferase family A protein [Paraglaciecola sp. L3A3]